MRSFLPYVRFTFMITMLQLKHIKESDLFQREKLKELFMKNMYLN